MISEYKTFVSNWALCATMVFVAWTYEVHEFTEYFRKRTTFCQCAFVCNSVNLRGIFTDNEIIGSNDRIKRIDETTALRKAGTLRLTARHVSKLESVSFVTRLTLLPVGKPDVSKSKANIVHTRHVWINYRGDYNLYLLVMR